MIPLITCEVSLCQYVCEMVFGVNVFVLDLRIQIDSVKHPIKSNSVDPGNMSHGRTSPLYDHLDHCFVVFKHIQQSFLMRRVDVWGNRMNIIQIIGHSSRSFSFLNRVRRSTNFTSGLTSRPVFVKTVIRVPKNCNDQIPEIKCGDIVQSQSCIQGNDFGFCWAVQNWSLLLIHPTDWNERVTYENA